jgi:hypothetical protein
MCVATTIIVFYMQEIPREMILKWYSTRTKDYSVYLTLTRSVFLIIWLFPTFYLNKIKCTIYAHKKNTHIT